MESDECDEINLIDNEIENDCYYVKIIKDTNKKINIFLDVKLEFSDHLCIYEILTEEKKEKLLYEISYYNILSWLYGKNQFGINYQNYNKKQYQLIFNVEKSSNVLGSIKNKINELLEYTGQNKTV